MQDALCSFPDVSVLVPLPPAVVRTLSRDTCHSVSDVSRGARSAAPQPAGGGGHCAGLAVPPGVARLPGRRALVPRQHGLVERLDRLCQLPGQKGLTMLVAAAAV